MVTLKDSPNKKEIREHYEQVWNELLERDEEEAKRVLEKLTSELLVTDKEEGEVEYELLPTHQKSFETMRLILSLFKTRLLWILLLSVIAFFLLSYVLFIYVSLWVEDY
ncbi:hypothetical protein [Paenibacillus polymyxa]|uniref:Uncharacterized protein n=1 Tax=Paenibacillus polymyxa (strain SC2) TaxID=886882 RepID=E3EKI2_PAEPS|nr:hypothetical protein [Paenibacillus polymyxa]ADO59814.1 hypothetical protein PPSC2_26095 [Paenibacillus polymyxa SC2]WPQ59951.1 hypothetical protein SKN87_27295 [Paenibacillus polymyxa]